MSWNVLSGNIHNKKIKQWERLGNARAAGVGVDVTTRRSALPDSPLVSGCAGLQCRAWASPSRGSFSLVRLGLRDVWLGSRGTWA